jgi:ArsR family transcriptional regulator
MQVSSTQRRSPRPLTPRQAARRKDGLDALLDPALFAALADPTRVRLVSCIAKCCRACTVGEIAECCSVDLSVVSRHLKALGEAGVLSAARDGRIVRYSLRADELATRLRALADALEEKAPDCETSGDCCGGPTRGCC